MIYCYVLFLLKHFWAADRLGSVLSPMKTKCTVKLEIASLVISAQIWGRDITYCFCDLLMCYINFFLSFMTHDGSKLMAAWNLLRPMAFTFIAFIFNAYIILLPITCKLFFYFYFFFCFVKNLWWLASVLLWGWHFITVEE